jgi:beta-galactosidase
MLLVSMLVLENLPAQLKHSFSLGKNDFLLDGKPFQIRGGEMHPARIPREYWRHRIQMAKAMGLNTIAVYVFWNYHERTPGKFDFTSGNHNIAEFFRLCQQEGMWVNLRPGPYVCAEWDFGGIPSYLLKYPDLKIRCTDERYMKAVRRYISALANVVRPFLVHNGGPILMVQIENEYGSYGNDKAYLEELRKSWRNNGVDGPFFTADGATPYMLEAGTLLGAAVGLDPGTDSAAFALARNYNPEVPAFCSELYPGWLTHWGEKWAKAESAEVYGNVHWLLERKQSFSLYMVHGGTNFGMWAGANGGGPNTSYEPHVTSYDYDAPVNEQGRPRAPFFAFRDLIARYSGETARIPNPIPAMEIPEVTLNPFASATDFFQAQGSSPQPKPMEFYGMNHGLILYSTQLIGHKSGKLTIHDVHDYALVFLNGQFVDTLLRGKKNTIELPKTAEQIPQLDIVVESMGRVNYGQYIIDRKGITDRVTLNGMTLMNWQTFILPIGDNLPTRRTVIPAKRFSPITFFKGSFSLSEVADTYLDFSNFKKGVVWINGHNLGRYWEIGPQHRLYIPAPWLRKGTNDLVVLDLLKATGGTVTGFKTLE